MDIFIGLGVLTLLRAGVRPRFSFLYTLLPTYLQPSGSTVPRVMLELSPLVRSYFIRSEGYIDTKGIHSRDPAARPRKAGRKRQIPSLWKKPRIRLPVLSG
jgi:hypothetical protein